MSNVELILKNKRFRASYNIENVQDFFPNENYLAVPMVCFCDIPLKFITKDHTIRYGYLGLGFKKEWGLRNKINPITYRTKESSIEKSFRDLLDQTNLINKEVDSLKLFQDANEGLVQTELERIEYSNSMVIDRAREIAAFVKPYSDDDMGEERNNYVDREWRWVPDEAMKTFCENNEEERRDKMNEDYRNGSPDYLNFEVGDVNYLIVRKRSDIDGAVKIIRSLKLRETEKDNLIQKVIDLESINLDM